MLRTYHRPADELDLKAFRYGKGALQRNLVTVAIPVTVIVFAGAYLLFRSVRIATAIAAVLFLASAASNLRFFRAIKRRHNLKEDANAVEVLEVSASAALDLEPIGDNAPAYCFFIGEGKALLLIGQWFLYDSFPAREFRLHRWADTREPIRIDGIEQPIDAESSQVRLRSTHRFSKVEVIQADRRTLQEDLDRALVGGRR
jgi:hypothetical protein